MKKQRGARRNRDLDGGDGAGDGARLSENDPLYGSVQCEVNKVFSKIFHFPANCNNLWTLPSSTSQLGQTATGHEQHPDLAKLQGDLNKMKGFLSNLDICRWHEHTGNLHQGGKILSHVRNTIKPELCTQAWCKFYEIVTRFDMVQGSVDDDGLKSFNSVHLCEAPGAFVTGLNHFLQNEGLDVRWRWMASTLNPYYEGNKVGEMIPDDRFIVDTTDRWDFGRDNTGSILEPSNVRHLIKKCRGLGQVHLVTADGSIDCANTPSEQEVLTSRLHFCEVAAALNILSPGGSLLLKMFTMFEASSCSLLYLLATAFQQLSVFKPVASKPGNSEVYIVATGYTDLDLATKTNLIDLTSAPGPGGILLPQDTLPDCFRIAHRQCCQQFIQSQMETIARNLELYHDGDKMAATTTWLGHVKTACCEEYVSRCRLRRISFSQRVVSPKANGLKPSVWQFRPVNLHEGSFVDRLRQSQLSWQDKLLQISESLSEDTEPSLIWFEEYADVTEEEVDTWLPETGKPPTRIYNSQFCDCKLLDSYNFVMDRIETGAGTADTAKCLQNLSTTYGQVDTTIAALCACVARMTENKSSVEHVTCDICDLGESRILSMNFYDPDMSDALWATDRRALRTLLGKLQTLPTGSHVVCTSGPCLTRLQAAFVYVLLNSFRQVAIAVPETAEIPIFVVCALNFRRLPHALERYLMMAEEDLKVTTRGLDTSDPAVETLSIVAIQALLDSRLQPALSQVNNLLLKRRARFLVQRETGRLQAEQEPHDS